MTRRVALTLAGYLGTLAVVALGVFLYMHRVETRIERHIDEVLIQRPDRSAKVPPPEGGDALQQPSSTAHQPSGPRGGGGPGKGGSGPPASHTPVGEPGAAPEVPTPVATEPGHEPEPILEVTPTLDGVKSTVEGVCAAADRLADLC